MKRSLLKPKAGSGGWSTKTLPPTPKEKSMWGTAIASDFVGWAYLRKGMKKGKIVWSKTPYFVCIIHGHLYVYDFHWNNPRGSVKLKGTKNSKISMDKSGKGDASLTFSLRFDSGVFDRKYRVLEKEVQGGDEVMEEKASLLQYSKKKRCLPLTFHTEFQRKKWLLALTSCS